MKELTILHCLKICFLIYDLSSWVFISMYQDDLNKLDVVIEVSLASLERHFCVAVKLLIEQSATSSNQYLF